MKFSGDGHTMTFAGDKYHLKKRFDVNTMERYYDLTSEQDRFLKKMVRINEPKKIEPKQDYLFIGNRHLTRIKNILKIMSYLEKDKKLLNKIGKQYKKIQDENRTTS